MHPTTYKAKAYSAANETSPLTSTTIPRRDPTNGNERGKIAASMSSGRLRRDLNSLGSDVVGPGEEKRDGKAD